MKKNDIKPFDLWRETMNVMERHGLLLCTVGSDGKPNAMNVAWLTGGLIWGRPIITVLVKTNRHSFNNLEQTNQFTVNVLPPEFANALQYLGTASGATEDKFAKSKLTSAPSQAVKAPLIAEGVVHYECRVVHKNDVIAENLTPEIASLGINHRVYFGEIVAASAAPDAAKRLA
ncbi:MAG: flavin reductase family protein [Verrucomicrobiia bacterium]|jgi:flavin reductase (DIM6/NTAB) family NADH-FMN oxidoreductase RutF